MTYKDWASNLKQTIDGCSLDLCVATLSVMVSLESISISLLYIYITRGYVAAFTSFERHVVI